MSPRLRAYVTATGLVALALLATHLPPDLAHRWPHAVAWIVICLVSETMWTASMTGAATLSHAAVAGLSVVVLWGPVTGMWIAGLSTLIADLFVQRKPWVRASFNSSQIAITSWLAGSAFALLGGRVALPLGTGVATFDRAASSSLVLPVVALLLVYFVLNRAMVALAVSWSSDRDWWNVLLEDWLYLARLEVDAASFLLVPLMVIAFTAVGYPGVLLFYAPLFMLFQSDRRYFDLKRAEEQNLLNAAFAAKGELAAGLGHNLNNMLGGIRGAAQLLQRDIERQKYEKLQSHTQLILDGTKNMGALAAWLQDYKRTGFKLEETDLNGLITSTIAIVKSDKRLRGVEWNLDLDPQLPHVQLEVSQVQNVFINLFVNAGDVMAKQETPRMITVTSEHDPATRIVRVVVADSGPGIAPENMAKMFRPKFTTKEDGHGFGLSTALRSIETHGGRMTVESPPGSGAQFTVQLPVKGPGVWS